MYLNRTWTVFANTFKYKAYQSQIQICYTSQTWINYNNKCTKSCFIYNTNNVTNTYFCPSMVNTTAIWMYKSDFRIFIPGSLSHWHMPLWPRSLLIYTVNCRLQSCMYTSMAEGLKMHGQVLTTFLQLCCLVGGKGSDLQIAIHRPIGWRMFFTKFGMGGWVKNDPRNVVHDKLLEKKMVWKWCV